jgi:hypothetical protein
MHSSNNESSIEVDYPLKEFDHNSMFRLSKKIEKEKEKMQILDPDSELANELTIQLKLNFGFHSEPTNIDI